MKRDSQADFKDDEKRVAELESFYLSTNFEEQLKAIAVAFAPKHVKVERAVTK